ncbi:MAG: DUF4349 domain-containing protein [Lachnospiraceae bacterium]|nr:DUF4349 domain-containing protein [Lachnospiraceae bacterium]
MKKKIKLLVLSMVLALGLSACGGSAATDSAWNESKAEMSTSAAAPETMYDSEMGFSDGTSMEVTEEASGSQTTALTDRKLIKTVDMSVETKEYDNLLAAVENKVKSLGGYIENMETYNGSAYSSYRSSRNANMTLRIPQESLDAFLEEISAISNVVRHSENVDDVTLQYVDLSSHKEVLLAEQERLLELIEQADTIEDIITLENRLSDIRYQIESMESQLRTYDNKVTYSTVYLYIDEVKELTPVKEETVWERITGGFAESIDDIVYDITEAFIWFVVNIPYLLIWAVVIIVVVLVLKKIKKRTIRMKKQEAALTKENEGQGKNE